MKNWTLLVCFLSILVAACDAKNESVEPTVDPPHHLTIDISVKYAAPDTRAVKSLWESGDKVYVFIDLDESTTEAEYITLTYDGSVWNSQLSKDTMEDEILKKSKGKLYAVYFPFGTPKFSFETSSTEKNVRFNLGPENSRPNYRSDHSYCIGADYKIENDTLIATLDMSLGDNLVFFSIPGIDKMDNFVFSCNHLMPTLPLTIRYSYDTGPSSFHIETDNDEFEGPMKGYLYKEGIVFSGILKENVNEYKSDFFFTLTDTKGTDGTDDDVVYNLVVPGQTIGYHDAVELPAFDSGSWTIKGETINGHECVDMGNGLKWATMNIGANSETEYGSYFAWGETTPKTDFYWRNYKLTAIPESVSDTEDFGWLYIFKYTIPDGRTKGCWYDSGGRFVGDGNIAFEAYGFVDDAARQNWGSTWRIPTSHEWEWLWKNCTNQWYKNYNKSGVSGCLLTSKITGNQIFLPAAGLYEGSTLYLEGDDGWYWSSTLSARQSSFANNMTIWQGSSTNSEPDRICGLSVRPVSGFLSE